VFINGRAVVFELALKVNVGILLVTFN